MKSYWKRLNEIILADTITIIIYYNVIYFINKTIYSSADSMANEKQFRILISISDFMVECLYSEGVILQRPVFSQTKR